MPQADNANKGRATSHPTGHPRGPTKWSLVVCVRQLGKYERPYLETKMVEAAGRRMVEGRSRIWKERFTLPVPRTEKDGGESGRTGR